MIKKRSIAVIMAIVMTVVSCFVVLGISGMYIPDTSSNVLAAQAAKSKKVFYVKGTSKKYHCTKRCRGLSRSKHISKTTLKKAKRMGLKPCKLCY